MCAPVHFNIKQRSSPKNVLINVRHRVMAFILLRHYRKGRFTLHNICLKLSHATCLQLELYCVTQAHNSPTTTWTSCFTLLMKTGLNNILLPILSWLLTVLFSQTMLNNIVNNQEQYGQQNIVQACFQQHCYRLGVFCSVHSVCIIQS